MVFSFGACIAAVAFLMATTTASSFARERDQASKDLAAAAKYNGDLEVATVPEVNELLTGLTELESIASLNPSTCASALEGLESVADQGSIYILGADRVPVCSLLATRRQVVDVPAGDWFDKVQKSQEPQYALAIERATGTPLAIFAVPLAGAGAVVAVLDSAHPPLEIPPNTWKETVVVELSPDRRFVVSASPNAHVKPGVLPKDSWLRRPLGGEHQRTDSDGVVRIYEEVPVEELDRVVLAGVARDVALRAAQQERNRNLVLAAVILVIVSGLGWLVQRRIAKPLARLRASVRDAGDDGSVQAAAGGPAEVAALADEFNATMTKRRALELDLAASVEKAEAASRMKSLFLANVSHEIRTPLNGVLGMIGLLRDENPSEAQRDYIDTMDDSAAALMSIITDLLDFSKIEAGMLEVEDVDFPLRACLRSGVAPWVPAAKDKGVGLTVDLDPSLPETVSGDPTRLRQVLSNLVDNAVKFTSHGAVSVRAFPTDGGDVRVEVVDTGIGIDEVSSEHLFEGFVQGDPSMTRRFGGTGLGLAICKQLVTLMHGSIGVRARVAGGSMFWFELPLAAAAPAIEAPAPVAKEPASAPVAEGRGRVLIVEDNPVNQKVARALVGQLGFDVDVAVNGAEGVRMVEAGGYVAVLMDLQMPVMDGFEATVAIRQQLGSMVPVLALSASVLPEDIARCEAVGMNGHLGKPVDRAALRAELERLAAPAARI